MKAVLSAIKNFIREEEGVTMVEYGLIAALISVVCIVALTNIGTNINIAFKEICNKLNAAVTGGTGC